MAAPDSGAIAPPASNPTTDTRALMKPNDDTIAVGDRAPEVVEERDDLLATTAKPRPFIETSTTDEISPELLKQRICDLDLRIEGTQLGRVVDRFIQELKARGFTRVHPAFYLSSEWGVVEGTTAIAIPFYLADERLRKVQETKGGIVEGTSDDDIMRYLRHEMGHVINY